MAEDKLTLLIRLVAGLSHAAGDGCDERLGAANALYIEAAFLGDGIGGAVLL